MRRKTQQLEDEPVRPGNLAVRFPVLSDYEPVRPSRQRAATDSQETRKKLAATPPTALTARTDPKSVKRMEIPQASESDNSRSMLSTDAKWKLKRGHGLTYGALFLFTIVLYARPAEFYPSPLTASLALIVALATLAFFFPTQLSLDGTLTARPSEVNLVLLFCLTALLSIPLAINPPIAWQEFSGTFIRCIVMFIVIVNVVRTKARLKGLLFLAIAAGFWLSVEAINEYRSGLMLIEGYRASGRGTGIFGNTNDMALHVVTVFPIVIALLFGSKSVALKFVYGACAAVLLCGIVLSFSRGAFLSLIVVTMFVSMKMAPRHRISIIVATVALGGLVLLLAPDQYGGRLLSIFDSSRDSVGSASARQGELLRSIYVALRHPLLGIGMGNYQPEMSHRGLVTHNSYTQVAAELGATALVCYTLFIVTPFRKLGQVARETFKNRGSSDFYYLSVGLQASLLAYMVSSFFLSVSYVWYVYYLVGFAVCLRRLYQAETGKELVVETRKERKEQRRAKAQSVSLVGGQVART